jgi:glycosyltransferase involved in cell wall biosynthesis
LRVLHVGYGFRPWRHGGLIAYAEDLMEFQAARGDRVAYFFRGRHYPGLRDDRAKAWNRRGVEMREILNSSLVFGGNSGTLTPWADLAHPPSERHFADTLEDLEPEVVHVHELIGLPSSLTDIAARRGVPVVATLQDYFPLCPVLKLYDVDGQLCLRHDVGAQCARCSSAAPADRASFAQMTVAHALRRVLGRRGAKVPGKVLRLVRRGAPGEARPVGRPAPAAEYQRRRDVNVERLNRLDAVVAQSSRLAEIYAGLGVREDRLHVMQLTLSHIDRLTHVPIEHPPAVVRFVASNVATSAEKGGEVLAGAAEAVEAAGLGDKLTLSIYGWVAPPYAERFARLPFVEMLGDYEPAQVNTALSGFHVGIVPSVWEEAYGYIGPELLAKGIPVIGNARGGIVDYTRDGETGWVNRSCDAAGLATIVEDIVRRPEQLVDLNRRLRERRAELIKPLADHVSELDDLYARLATADA